MQKNQGTKSKDEKNISPFFDRQADIVAYRGSICNKK